MRVVRLMLVLALAGWLPAACAGGGDDPDETATATETMTAAGSPTATVEATATRPPVERPISPTTEPETEASPTALPPTPSATARATATAPIRSTATQPPAPATATVSDETPDAITLMLVEHGFSEIQSYDEVAFGFVVENPDGDSAVINSEYRVTAYQGGTELESEEGYLDYVLPGERVGVGGSIFIPSGRNADSISVEIISGERAEPELDPGFTVGNVTYYPESLFPSATGVISTTFDRPLQDFEVFAIGYDETGAIIGGGYTFVSFILAGGSTGVEVNLASVEEPARVELFPVVTSLTIFGLEDVTAVDALPLEIVDEGFGPSVFENELGWGIIVANPNPGLAAETTAYQATAYAADGTVLGVYSSFISLLLPEERLGLGGSFYLPDGTTAERMEFEVLGRYFGETDMRAGFLSSVDVTIAAGEFSPRVTGAIQNSLDRDLTDIEVYAIAYDAAGKIIGGGFTFVDLIAAGGEAAVELTIAVGEEPATVELYATVSSLTDIE